MKSFFAAVAVLFVSMSVAHADDFLTLGGGKVTSAQFSEGKTVLFFWTTWCPYCRKQLDFLKTQMKQFDDRSAKLYLVNIGEDQKKVAAFVSANGLPADRVVLNKDSSLAYKYNVMGFPTYLFMYKGEELTQSNFFTDATLQKTLKLFDAMDAYDKQEAAKAVAPAATAEKK